MASMDNPTGIIESRWTVKATYIIAVIFLVLWACGFLIFHVGSPIHVLLILSMMAILVNIIRES